MEKYTVVGHRKRSGIAGNPECVGVSALVGVMLRLVGILSLLREVPLLHLVTRNKTMSSL